MTTSNFGPWSSNASIKKSLTIKRFDMQKVVGSSLLLLAMATSSFGATSMGQIKNPSVTETDFKYQGQIPAESGDTHFTGKVFGQSNQMASGVGGNVGNRYNFGADLNFHQNSVNDLEKNVEASTLVNDAGGVMFSLKEANLTHHFRGTAITYGREKLDWSSMDADWGFGKVNNRMNFNGFTPGQEGLTGAVVRTELWGGFNLSLFGSYLYIPETNPSMDIDNQKGTITSKNPWAKTPNTSTKLDGQDIAIKYQVDYPNYNDIILRKSRGINLGFNSKHVSFNGFFLNKPENQLSESVEVTYNNLQKAVTARVKPQVFYHEVLGANFTIKYNNFGIYASSLSIRPNSTPDTSPLVTQYTAIETQKRREDYAGVGAYYLSDVFTAKLNYVARTSTFDLAGDMLAEAPRWNQAVNVVFILKPHSRWDFNVDVKYDTLTFDRLYMANANYMLTKSLSLGAGAYIIGSPANSRSYWNVYRNNDAVFSNLRFIF